MIPLYYFLYIIGLFGVAPLARPSRWRLIAALVGIPVAFGSLASMDTGNIGQFFLWAVLGLGITCTTLWIRQTWPNLVAELTLLAWPLAVIQWNRMATPETANIVHNITLVQIHPILAAIAALVLLTRGGAYFVKLTLDETKNSIPVGQSQFGFLIGITERLLLAGAIFTNHYDMVGWILAGKGLVRWKKFEEDKDFAEYFLLGTFTSLLIALVVTLAYIYTTNSIPVLQFNSI